MSRFNDRRKENEAWVPPIGDDRLPVEFWGGPACGSVIMCPAAELPDNLCRHPRFPDDEYILFKRLSTGKLVARYVRPSVG